MMLLKVVLIVLMSQISIQAYQHSKPTVETDVLLERFYNLFEELEIVVKEVIASGSLSNSIDPDNIDNSSRSVIPMTFAENLQNKLQRIQQRRNKIKNVLMMPANQRPLVIPIVSVYPVSPGMIVSNVMPASPVATFVPAATVLAPVPLSIPLSVFSPLKDPLPEAIPIPSIIAAPLLAPLNDPLPDPLTVSLPPLMDPSPALLPAASIVTMLASTLEPPAAPLSDILMDPLPEALSPVSLTPYLPEHLTVSSPVPTTATLAASLPVTVTVPSTAPVTAPLSAIQSLPLKELVTPILVASQSASSSDPLQSPLSESIIVTDPVPPNLTDLIEISFQENVKPNEWPFITNKN